MKGAALLLLTLAVAGCGGGGGGKQATMHCDVTVQGDRAQPDLPKLEEGKTHLLAVRTSKGAFTIELDTSAAPCASASMVALARKGFFNGTRFHRIVPGFVIQGGDPTGTGTGGPGYSTVDTPPSDTKYTRGVVAMAKTLSEPAGSAGSQFFVVTGADVGLPPDYAVLGKVVDGLDVVERIGKLGNAREQPTEKVEIESVDVEAR